MKYILAWLVLMLISCQLIAQSSGLYNQKEIIYGRKDGMAMTMLMLNPKNNRNGKAIINLVSGGWYTQFEWLPDYTKNAEIYLKRGYTVFLVMPSGRPMFNIMDGIQDAKRSVRFVRFHSAEYKIDPNHIGITGMSSGGHLSLAVATDDDKTDRGSKDPVERVSCRVQAAACFYPPSDFLNWGNIKVDPENKYLLDQSDVYSAFDFREWDPNHKNFVLISDPEKLKEIYKKISPIYQVSPDDPPILLAHGNADAVVPFSQSEKLIEKLKKENIVCGLLVKQGGGHGGWNDEAVFENKFADWFDEYLK